jgi:hypothetical protein
MADSDRKVSGPTYPLSALQFARALKAGHGRAALHAKRFGLGGLKKILLRQARRFNGYDPQIEGYRTDFLGKFIARVDTDGSMREQLWRDLLAAWSHHDRYHLFDLALFFALRGDERARLALDESLKILVQGDRHDRVEPNRAYFRLAGMTGLAAYLDALRASVEEHNEEVELSDFEWILGAFSESNGERQRASELVEATIAQFAKPAESSNPTGRWGPESMRPKGDWESDPDAIVEHLRAQITGDSTRLYVAGLSKRIGDVLTAAKRGPEVVDMVVQQTKVPALRRGLCALWSLRIFERDPRILAFALHESWLVRLSTKRVLSLHPWEAARELAVRLLKDGSSFDVACGPAKILVPNFRDGDEALLLNAAGRLRSPEDRHSFVLDVLSLIEHNPQGNWRDLVLWVYERTPCSHCRESAVEVLLDRKEAPLWLIQEARWDSQARTRALARRALQAVVRVHPR